MQALGLIETRGLIAAIESADAMLKAAEVSLLEKTYVGGGLVAIAVTGDVGAVKAAVEAGGAAVRQLNNTLLISEHVIPRPHQDLDDVIVAVTPLKKMETELVVIETTQPEMVEDEVDLILEINEEMIDEETTEEVTIEEVTTEEVTSEEEDLNELHKETVDKMVSENGLEEAIEVLSKLKVVKLRNLAREYKEFGIAGRLISKADKQMLLAEFTTYYGKK